MTEPNKQLAGKGRWRHILGYLGKLADMYLGLLLVKASLGVQLGSSHAYPGSAEAATNCGLVVSLNKFPRATHRQSLTLGCIRVLPRSPEPTQPVAGFRQHQIRIQLALQITYPKGGIDKHLFC